MTEGLARLALRASAFGVARARATVSGVFFLSGFLFANWLPRIPEKRDALGVGEGALGLALLALALGALVAMRAAGRLTDRFGARRPMALALALHAPAFAALALADGLATVAAALFFYGAAAGAVDVAMNVEGVGVERRAGRPIFSAFHGMFSLGGMAGAALGGLAAEAGSRSSRISGPSASRRPARRRRSGPCSARSRRSGRRGRRRRRRRRPVSRGRAYGCSERWASSRCSPRGPRRTGARS